MSYMHVMYFGLICPPSSNSFQDPSAHIPPNFKYSFKIVLLLITQIQLVLTMWEWMWDNHFIFFNLA